MNTTAMRRRRVQVGDPLSAAEQQTLELLFRGYPERQIAELLVIHMNTVRYRVSVMRAKLGDPSGTGGLVRAAIESGALVTADRRRAVREFLAWLAERAQRDGESSYLEAAALLWLDEGYREWVGVAKDVPEVAAAA